MADDVHDNPEKKRFELTVEGITAYAEYVRKPGVITFTHTIVPEALGGKGVGSRLAKGALDAVRAEGLKVVPQCPFIAAYIKKHPEYQPLVVAD
ncbi:MAG: GNAT family N-acetyltransferase [Parvibaculum sp.]|jgi:predicted GNAT family acetyltransferase|uniref:GNAT family N-acetyltransferase n=1 Tax=Parvibaculum sp. TaxID=2024848 RepID=UPI00284C1347|nr:GNAT family N-acetyltransferase [Parvibaculum sp.]MDR3499316.1 GNAT family N-acetyltransferase [Parvibaculum sp.]